MDDESKELLSSMKRHLADINDHTYHVDEALQHIQYELDIFLGIWLILIAVRFFRFLKEK